MPPPNSASSRFPRGCGQSVDPFSASIRIRGRGAPPPMARSCPPFCHRASPFAAGTDPAAVMMPGTHRVSRHSGPAARTADNKCPRSTAMPARLPAMLEQIVETRLGVETQQARFDGRARNVRPRGRAAPATPRPTSGRVPRNHSGLDDLQKTRRPKSVAMSQTGDPRDSCSIAFFDSPNGMLAARDSGNSHGYTVRCHLDEDISELDTSGLNKIIEICGNVPDTSVKRPAPHSHQLLFASSMSPTIIRRPGRPRREIDPEKVIALRTTGLSLRQISTRTHLGYGTIRRALQHAGDATKLSQNPTAHAKNS